MTQADEDEELDLNGPGADEEIGDDVEDIDVEAEVDEVVDGSGESASDDDEEAVIDKPRGKRVAAEAVAVEDVANIEARRHVREQLESDVEAFLRRGGKIVAVEEDLRADPPKKPESKYGTRSI